MSDHQENAGPIPADRSVSAAASRGPGLSGTKLALLCGVATVAALAFIFGRPEGQKSDPATQAALDRLRVAMRAHYEPPRPDPPQPVAPPAPLAASPVSLALPSGVASPGPLSAPSRQATAAVDPTEAARKAPLLMGGSTQSQPSPDGAPLRGRESGGKEESELAAQLRPTRLAGVRAMRRENLALIVQPGTPLSCVMQTAFDSTQPSMPVCVLTRDVYGATGTVVVMERGTRLVGESRGRLQQGQARVFVIWERAITPAGVEVELASPATDALGRGGITGDLDTRFWDRFGGALLLSLVSDGVSAGASALAGGSGGMGFMGGRTFGTGQTAASEAMRNSVNIPPVLRINQGAEVAVMISRTLDFSGVYSLGDAR